MKLTIKVTKAILMRSMDCGFNPNKVSTTRHCAIAEAVRDIFPYAEVTYRGEEDDYIAGPGALIKVWLFKPGEGVGSVLINLPREAYDFMQHFDYPFDGISIEPSDVTLKVAGRMRYRMNLPETSFDIEVPSILIDHIGISEVYKILSESKTVVLATEFVSI